MNKINVVGEHNQSLPCIRSKIIVRKAIRDETRAPVLAQGFSPFAVAVNDSRPVDGGVLAPHMKGFGAAVADGEGASPVEFSIFGALLRWGVLGELGEGWGVLVMCC